jgi:hypothetical protein
MSNPTDEQLDELWDEIGGYYNLYPEVRNTIREALNRWGNVEDVLQYLIDEHSEVRGTGRVDKKSQVVSVKTLMKLIEELK